ncbi:isopentenyl-diphosphate delta-isomerase [Propionibacterium cyclohexanicum]|uniref:Isopentenyl-diphosphate delta-isomerase n=1 Tax=Propionibacterium cyclohexanicum TaxID=64702 RepID=A0A1H9Q0V3_9ACTN|nr:type 2 isopentenyl-diphosphate Delta-isomerase [Propionibacterium cyclohexanicum]SER53599.1 isopentenyl-diphosphate delta-isomerase [Propionibacterium cyclohexanicum]
MSTERKDQHVALAQKLRDESRPNGFDDIGFIHHSLAAIDVARVDLSTSVLGARWPLPFYINAMTGGSQRTARINAGLGRAARAAGVAIATGSQHIALRDASLEDSFRVVRREAPDAFVFANVGPTVSPEQARRAVQMLDADALQVHINPAQEIVMPEGDRQFSDWAQRIEAIAGAVPVPVLAKEVGFGLSRRSIEELARRGVRAADVSGAGGTNFIDIENHRRRRSEYGYLAGWGQSSAFCLLESLHLPPAVPLEILASGGVRHPLDVVRALALGARAVGVSGHFLHTLLDEGEEALIAELARWAEQLSSIMALMGCASLAELSKVDLLVTGRTAELARLRGIDLAALAHRQH